MLKRMLLTLIVLMLTGLSLLPAAAQENAPENGYAAVNGLEMYYEIHGSGEPIVVIHGAYMSIVTMGEIVPLLAETRQVIAVELQGHGRTADIADRPFSYEQLADDVAALMDTIEIEHADIFGFSLGGGVALKMGLRHPEKVDRLVVLSAGYSSEAYHPGFYEMLDMMSPDMFAGTPVITDYEALAPNPENFPLLVEKFIALDKQPFDWTAEAMQAMAAPTFILLGDSDLVRLEHAVDLFRQRGGGVDGEMVGLPNSRLAILPATTHIGILFRAGWFIPMVNEFLDAPLVE